MERTFCNWIFATVILITTVTLAGNSNVIIKFTSAYRDVSFLETASVIMPVSESTGEKQTNQLDSSLSSFVDTNKEIVMHIHPRLNVTLDSRPLIIQAGIGINTTLWNDHSLDQYGMQPMKMTMKDMSMMMQGMAPLHTHDTSGIIHVESNVIRNYTLGQFLQNWGLNLDGKEVTLTVDGNTMKDYKNHILTDKERMFLDIEDQKNVTSS